ncbi:MAG: hypothetical protein M3437_08025 [Chloroflexota bacterium]|nr:hypothetical protein [Chloroflexota bacterium]MDQ5864429.1 hypothetical protein [Chloroflexota bacterium]
MHEAGPISHPNNRSSIVVLVALFGFCSLSGFVWGLIVRTPPPPDRTIESLTVFPAAFGVATPTQKPPGLGGPTATAVINSTAEGLLNYDFRTTDSPEEVVAFYTDLMQKRYGFKVWWVEEVGGGMQVLNFLREGSYWRSSTSAGWYKEYVTVTITEEGPGQLYVEVRHDVR